MKATYDQDRYDFEAARANGLSSAAKKERDRRRTRRASCTSSNLAREKAEADKADDPEAARPVHRRGRRRSQKQIDEINAEQNRLRKRLDVIAPSAVKDYFRNAPLLDFMAPTLKVQQIILPNVVDDVNFIRVPKMDRCQTCHLAIDKKGYEKYPQPFTTHPDLATVSRRQLAAPDRQDRLHGVPRGHGAVGQLPRRGAHAAATRSRRRSGRRSTTGRSRTCGTTRCCRSSMTEASCAKCHKQQVYIPKAEKLNVAYATFERAGCYACHKTKGFENVKKPGPILTKIDSKLSPDWVKNWIRNPQAVKPTTWMPRFWYNSNNSAPEDAVAQRGRDQRDRRVSVRERREARVRGEEPAARRREARRGDRQVDRLPGLPRRRRGRRAPRPARAAPSASRSRTSATRRPTSGSTTGSAIRSTTARRPTCRTCGSPTRRWPTSRRTSSA